MQNFKKEEIDEKNPERIKEMTMLSLPYETELPEIKKYLRTKKWKISLEKIREKG